MGIITLCICSHASCASSSTDCHRKSTSADLEWPPVTRFDVCLRIPPAVQMHVLARRVNGVRDVKRTKDFAPMQRHQNMMARRRKSHYGIVLLHSNIASAPPPPSLLTVMSDSLMVIKMFNRTWFVALDPNCFAHFASIMQENANFWIQAICQQSIP